MNYRYIAAGVTVLVAIQLQVLSAAPGATALPVKNGRLAVATVNSDAISLDEFVAQMTPPIDRARLKQGRGTAEELDLLERLITIKLLVREATAMGIADLPEIKRQVDVSSREILREVLLQRVVKDVKPDPAKVERAFKELSKEWKTASLLFRDEPSATRALKDIQGGATFADVAAKAVAAKAAQSESDPNYHVRSEYLPQIVAAIGPLKIGQVTPVLRLQSGFAIVTVLDLRHPENAAARAEARKKVLDEQQLVALKAHGEALKKQYAVVNTTLLKSINYEAAKPGVDALLKDKRVVVQIKGGDPVTIADLTDYLRMQYFHGSDQAKQHREMNLKKDVALEATLSRRLLNLEAARLGIDKTAEYRDRVNGYRESLVFDTFIQKVIAPGNKMHEEEVKKYYDSHAKEYSNPVMIKARSLGFSRRSAAELAIKKLREGTDFKWMAANAEGQIDSQSPEALRFDGKPVMVDSMPEAVQKALAGCKNGEFRLYEAPDGRAYVVAIDQVIQPGPRPYEDVHEDIARKLYNEKLKKSVVDYAAKVRAQSKVATYLKKV